MVRGARSATVVGLRVAGRLWGRGGAQAQRSRMLHHPPFCRDSAPRACLPHVPPPNQICSHYHINDATGASLVLQFDAAGRLQPLDNPFGVLTNAPNLEGQINHTDWYMDLVSKPPYSEVPTVHGGPFAAIAGSFNQTERFTRLAQLRSFGAQVAWPIYIPYFDNLTPAYVPPGAPASNPQLMVAINMMQSVWLPRGLDDSSASGAKSDWTVWGVVRDHALRGYYYRVANAPVYRAVHLARVNWSALAGRVRYSQMKTGGWAVDGTQDWAAAPMHDGPPANVPRGFFPLDV